MKRKWIFVSTNVQNQVENGNNVGANIPHNMPDFVRKDIRSRFFNVAKTKKFAWDETRFSFGLG